MFLARTSAIQEEPFWNTYLHEKRKQKRVEEERKIRGRSMFVKAVSLVYRKIMETEVL